jgi:ABC-type glutathione transport system ATPase component
VSLLEVDHLRISRESDAMELVHGVSFRVEPGRMHALVGESGSAKTVTARASIGLVANGLAVSGGSVRFDGTRPVSFAGLHGCRISMVMQNPRTALHPMVSIGKQMDTILRTHTGLARRERGRRCRELLDSVGLSEPERVLAALPMELSGGMAQRALIATALLCEPDLIIADEPTTGLDPTVATKVLELLREIQGRLGLGVLLITHDLAVVAHFADTVSVMSHGDIVEDGETIEVLRRPAAEYTRKLVAASRPLAVAR